MARILPQDPDNKIVQDTAGVWRLILDGVMLEERFPNQNAALAAYNEARKVED